MYKKNLKDILFEEIELTPEDLEPADESEVPPGGVELEEIGMDILQGSQLFDPANPDEHLCHSGTCNFDLDSSEVDLVESVIKAWTQHILD